MASFTETATLKVIDQSSAQIKAINTALKALFNTTKKLKSTSANFEVKTKGLAQATAMIGKVAKDAKALKGVAADIKVKVDTTQARQQLAALKKDVQQTGRQARAATRRGGGGGGDEEEGGGRRRRRGISAGQYAHSAMQGASQGLGIGIPLGGPPALMALELAAYGAAAALKKVAEGAMARDRAQLMAEAAATPGQRRILQADMANKAKDRGPMPMTDTDRLKLQTSLLGDVTGTTGEDRARAAVNVADYIEKQILPRQYALNPGKSFDEVQEGARKIVQAMNLASTDIVNETDKYDRAGKLVGRRGELSDEGKRVAEGIQLAQYAQPEMSPQLIKSTMANAKSLGFSAGPEAIAKMLSNAESRGSRAANEIYRAQEAFTGTVNVKQFNDMLAKRNLLENYTTKKGHIVTGSGRAKDAELLQQDPYTWFERNLRPQMDKELTTQAETRAKKSGKDSDRTVTQGDQTEWIKRQMAGMSAAAKQGVIDGLLGNEQANQTITQARDAISKNNLPDALKKSWVAQMEKVKTQLQNQADSMGDSAAKAMGLPEKLQLLSDAIKDPKGDASKTLLSGALNSITDILKMNTLEVAAKALQGAGVDLTAAAYKLMNKEPPPKPGSPEEQTATDIKTRDAAEASIADAKKKQLSIDERLKINEKERDPNKKLKVEQAAANARSAAAQQEAQATKDRDAANDRMVKRQADIVKQQAIDISGEDPYIITEVANAKAKADAEERVMKARQESAKKDREMYARENARRRKMTPSQREREDAKWRANQGKGTIDPYGPEKPAPEPEGPPKPPTPTPPVQPSDFDDVGTDRKNETEALKRAAELNDGSATKFTQAVTGMGTASTNFATAFDSGAVKLASAGKTAVSDMQNGASGIGAAIAAAFVAGASGLKVGVDTSGIVQAGYKSPANKGALTESA